MNTITLEERNRIRERYKNWKPRTDPYQYGDWISLFSPIENNVWSDIRYLGLPMYPQYPVGKYFIDFADPIKKIGIEVDGKEFHQDIEKDEFHQSELEKLGWEIIRITGDKTFKDRRSFISEDEEREATSEELPGLLAEYYAESSEGILNRIRNDHYR